VAAGRAETVYSSGAVGRKFSGRALPTGQAGPAMRAEALNFASMSIVIQWHQRISFLGFLVLFYHEKGTSKGVTITAYNNWEKLEIDGGFTAPMDGFLYVYVANESASDKEVFFDDIKILHESSVATFKVSQINDYYPFGMLTGNSWRNDAYIDPGMLYQEAYARYDSLTGYYDFLSRSYDPALGRFFAVDPAGQFSSPYLGMGNMPMLTVDPNGELAWFIPIIAGGLLNAAINSKGIGSFGDFMKFFAVGAASAAITAGVSNGMSSVLGKAGQTFSKGFSAAFKANGTLASQGLTMAKGAIAGIKIGAVSGAAGGFTGSLGNSFAHGQDFDQALLSGVKGMLGGSLAGSIMGGLSYGLKSHSMDENFWTGEKLPTGSKHKTIHGAMEEIAKLESADSHPNGDVQARLEPKPDHYMGYEFDGYSVADVNQELRVRQTKNHIKVKVGSKWENAKTVLETAPEGRIKYSQIHPVGKNCSLYHVVRRVYSFAPALPEPLDPLKYLYRAAYWGYTPDSGWVQFSLLHP
jgi:RHS repeat-associated protein